MRVLPLACLLLIAGCGGAPDDEDVPALNLAANGVPMAPEPARPDARGPGTALGLTQLQLEQAQLVGSDGRRLGEVEKVELDPAGQVQALRIELDDSIAVARVVRIGLNGLAAVRRGQDWGLRTGMTREALAAMPLAVADPD